MSVKYFKDGQLTLIAGGGTYIGGGNGEESFTGTKAEVEQAIAAGQIKENWTVYITDDIKEVIPDASNYKIEYITQEDYDALGEEKYENDIEYHITDGGINNIIASNIEYDNLVSGLTATNVQGAVDELSENLGSLFIIRKSNSVKITVPASGSARVSSGLSSTAPTGYTFVGSTTLSHSTHLILGAQLSNNEFYIVARNNSSSEVKDVSVSLSCIYVKTDTDFVTFE